MEAELLSCFFLELSYKTVIPLKRGINSSWSRKVTILVLKTAFLKLYNIIFQLLLTLIPLFRGMTKYIKEHSTATLKGVEFVLLAF